MSRKKRLTCRKCGISLDDSSPKRAITNTAGEVSEVFAGDCKRCASERVVVDRWVKRGIKEINKRFIQLGREYSLLGIAKLRCKNKV